MSRAQAGVPAFVAVGSAEGSVVGVGVGSVEGVPGPAEQPATAKVKTSAIATAWRPFGVLVTARTS